MDQEELPQKFEIEVTLERDKEEMAFIKASIKCVKGEQQIRSESFLIGDDRRKKTAVATIQKSIADILMCEIFPYDVLRYEWIEAEKRFGRMFYKKKEGE